MQTKPTLNSVLSLTGLAALTIYILACTSFSPDDSKVLYPTYDPKAGDFGVGLYDRQTGKASLLFMAQRPRLEESDAEPAWLRPQWLADGRNILVSWWRGSHDDKVELAVLPFGHLGPTRLIRLEDMPEAGSQLAMPLATAQGQLILRGESNVLVRVNLLTGEVSRHEMPGEVTPYASPAGDRVCYLAETDEEEKEWEFGQIDPSTCELKPMTKFKLEVKSSEGGLHAVSPDGKWVLAFDEDATEAGQIVLLENGVEKRRLEVAGKGEKVKLGTLVLSPANRTAYAGYFRQAQGETNASVGILEIPLAGGELRRTALIARIGAKGEERVFYFQPSVSHDGKTLAVASTYLAAGDEQIGEDDCALFLVDLTDPKRQVTRVPIPRPPKELD